MRKSFLGLIALITITTSSCTYIPCGWDSDLDTIKEEPQTENLIGRYRLDERTIKFIPGYENAQEAELNINADGTFDMQKIPKGTFDFMEYYNSMDINIDAKGRWKTSFNKGTAKLHVNVKFDSTKTDLKDFWTSWRIYEKDKKPVIFIIVGDPDECAAARFERIK